MSANQLVIWVLKSQSTKSGELTAQFISFGRCPRSLKRAIQTVEDQQGGSFGKCRGVKTPVESGYRPELDKTDELDEDKAIYV
jgi:hypothetical protein